MIVNGVALTKVLFVTSFHPDGAGNIGAGEAISGDSVRRLLCTGYEVHVLCVVPGYQRASQALMDKCASYSVVSHSSRSSLSAIATNFGGGAWCAPWFFTRVSPVAVAKLRELVGALTPDEVWLDFPSSLGFSRYVEDRRLVYFAHDIVSQKVRRSPVKRFISPLVRAVEKTLFARLSKLVTLSDKDVQLAREIGFSAEVEVWPPTKPKVGEVDNAASIALVTAQFGTTRNMVFFGHMGRPENHWSIIPFILGPYRKIRRSCPDVRLWIIGVQPKRLLKMLGKMISGVEVVGAVDNPTPAFEKCTLCIAPILFGAGVKIKVLQMLDAGSTVISTPTGAEGIAANERLTVVEWSSLSTRIVDCLEQTKVAERDS